MSRAALDEAYRLDPIHEQMLEVGLLPDGRAGERWAALRSRIDLDTFWDGKALDFLPLVYRALVDEGVDHPDLPRLRGVHRRAWYDNQLRFQRLADVLRVLDAGEVDAIVLKGVALAHLVYADVGLRPMADCDVLVRPGQVGRALALLADSGWAPHDPLPMGYARRHQEIDVFDQDRHVVDLHWHVSQWLVPDGDEWRGDDPVWDRSVGIDVAGAPARALGPSDALVHALVHGARHGWRDAPQWVPDAVLMTRTAEIDWPVVVGTARDRGIAYPVRCGLGYVADRFGAPVPTGVLDDLDVPLRGRPRRMFARSGRGHDPSPRAQRWFGPLAGTHRFWITQSAPMERRHAAATLPGWLSDYWRVRGPWEIPVKAARRVSGAARR